RAREYNIQAQRAAELAGDLVEASRSRNVEAYILSELGQPGERESLLEALRLADAAGWQRQRMIVLGNLADSHLNAGEFELAIERASEALELARAAGVARTESLALTNLGLAELGLGRIAAGAEHVEAALAVERRRNAHAEEAQILKELGRALERAGATTAAVDAYHRYRELQDSMLVRIHQRAVLDLQARYEREQRDRELALRAREAQLQEATLRSDALRRQVWLLGTVAGALALGVVALLLQQQRRANRAMADVNERLRAEGELDALTGLANRRHVQDRVGQPPAFHGALFLIDLDHFKRINDRHGHAGGDRVLVAVADRLREALRDSDLVARWGGEEFLVVTPSLGVQRAQELANRLLADIGGQPIELGAEASVRVSVSIGYASFPLAGAPDGLGWERALALVDRALYRAKARGRNRACGVLRWPGAEAVEAGDSLFERDEDALAWSEGPPLPPRAASVAGRVPEAAA
ncbi:diguanylate cyclase, partial [Caldimonas sp. KR1-144]|uniref:GGDEF domain-containing protein n=1 Tax=Caldimonas sp. KR1-144 TaxID=3400911 RepID=UPI003C0E7E74